MTDKCVGFADCPCRKCRATRVAATEAHPHHAHLSLRSYCEPCRRADRERWLDALYLPRGETAYPAR